MAIYNKRVKFSKENLIDHYLKRDSLSDIIYSIVRFIGIIIQNIYCISSYLIITWIFLFPISWIRNDLYSRVENYLYNSLLFIVSSWSLAAGSTVVEAGDDYKLLIEEPQTNLCSSKLKQTNCHNNNTKIHNQDQQTQKYENQSTSSFIHSDKITYNNHTSGDQISKVNSNSCPIKSINNNNIHINNNNINNQNSDSKLNIKSSTNGNNSVTAPDPRLSLSLNGTQKKPRILLLFNHISTADVPLIMQSFSTLTNQSILWVLDAQFKPTNFGLVCSSHGDFFIAKNSFADGSLKDQVLKHPDRNLLVLFPEGGFLRKRLEGSNRYALKNNLPLTNYVTHPRFGAFKDLIDPSVDVTHIVDATILYDDITNPLSILDITLGGRKEPVLIHYKVYNRSEINPTEEWLRNIWLEKDKLLRQYYEDRDSVYKRFGNCLRSAKLDWLKVVTIHLFYLLVCYLTVYRLFNATSFTMLKARELYYSNI